MKQVVVPVYVQAELAIQEPTAEKQPILSGVSDDELLGYGVPAEWLNDAKTATEDTLLALTDHLPGACLRLGMYRQDHCRLAPGRTQPDARVLLTTFSDTLANALQVKLRRLLGNEPRLAERIDVHSLNAIGLRLYKAHIGQATMASREVLRELIEAASHQVDGHKFGLHFLLTEWEEVVDAWQLADWEAYRDVVRLGRKTRLLEAQRKMLWSIFERVRTELQARQLISPSWTRRRTSASPISASSPPWVVNVPTPSSSPAISGSASSNSPSPGKPWATTPTCKKSTTPSVTYFTWLARGRGTTCLSRLSSRGRSFLMIWRCNQIIL